MQRAYSREMTNGSPRQVRRRENLRKIVEDNGGQAQVALEIGTPKSHLSAILAGRRGIGDELAHKIESHFDLPESWMDGDHGGSVAALTPEVAALAAAIDALSKPRRDRMVKLVWGLVEDAREVEQMSGENHKHDESAERKESTSSIRRKA